MLWVDKHRPTSLSQLDCPAVQPMSKLPAQISTKSIPLALSATIPELQESATVTLSVAVLLSSSPSFGVAVHTQTSSATVSRWRSATSVTSPLSLAALALQCIA